MNRLMRFLVGCAIGALVALLLLPRVKGDWRRLIADRVRSSLRQLLGLEPEAPVPAPQTAVSAPVESVVTPEPQGVAVGATSPAAPAEETPEMASAGPTAADLRARVEETRLAVKEALERPFGTLPAETTDTERPMEETPASGAAMLAATLAEADVGEELPSSAEETLAAESVDSPAVGAPETAEVECIASGVVVEAPPWVEVPTATLEEDSVVAVEETAAGQTLADDQAAQGLREEEVSAATDAELEIVDEQAAGPIAEETAADVEAEEGLQPVMEEAHPEAPPVSVDAEAASFAPGAPAEEPSATLDDAVAAGAEVPVETLEPESGAGATTEAAPSWETEVAHSPSAAAEQLSPPVEEQPPMPEVVVWPDVEEAFPPLPRHAPGERHDEHPTDVLVAQAAVSETEVGRVDETAADDWLPSVGEKQETPGAVEHVAASAVSGTESHGRAPQPVETEPAEAVEQALAEPEADTEPGVIDQVAMRRRIEETRNRLKAKAFDAMASGEAALLSRESGDRPLPSSDSEVLDEDVERVLDQSLSQEDY